MRSPACPKNPSYLKNHTVIVRYCFTVLAIAECIRYSVLRQEGRMRNGDLNVAAKKRKVLLELYSSDSSDEEGGSVLEVESGDEESPEEPIQ